MTYEQLQEFVALLESKLRKKTEDLTRTRNRLNKARMNIKRLKEIVSYQRKRIVQLYNED